MFKKIFMLIAIILAVLIAPGCAFPQPFPIENKQNILIIGFDFDGDDIVLTVLVDSIVQQGESGQEKISHKLYSAKGKTILEAKRKLHKFTDKKVAFYQLRYILIGEQAAENGVDRVIKFFTQDDETNFLNILIITKGMTAKEYLERENAGEKQLPDVLTSLFDETSKTGYSKRINVMDYAMMRETPWKSIYIPTILLFKDPIRHFNTNSQSNQQQSSQQPSTLSLLEGFGLFDEDKLIGFLDANMARGMLFIIGEIGSTAISVKDNNDNYVALEVMESRAKIIPEFEDPVSAVIEITVESNLDEYQESEEVLDEAYIKDLEEKLNEYIRNEALQTLSCLQDKQTDVIGMGDAFYHSNPVRWQDIEEDWKPIFSDLDIEVKVTSYIQYSYTMTNAIGE